MGLYFLLTGYPSINCIVVYFKRYGLLAHSLHNLLTYLNVFGIIALCHSRAIGVNNAAISHYPLSETCSNLVLVVAWAFIQGQSIYLFAFLSLFVLSLANLFPSVVLGT